MYRLVAYVVALLVIGCCSTPAKNIPRKIADPVLARRQYDLSVLFYHIYEPNHIPTCHAISQTWSLEKNVENFQNVTAVKLYVEMMEHGWILPRGVPFTVLEFEHLFEAATLFNMLFSAKDYNTFYKTAVFLRDRINADLFVYVLNIVILNRPDTQGIRILPINEVLPWYFNNGEIMTTAQRVNTHGDHMIDYYPSTYKWEDSVVIKWNETIWPYRNLKNMPIAYFTHDHALNTMYYNIHLLQPTWLGGEVVPLIKDRRGEMIWFIHKEFLTRYYMERLSNGLGEIPEIGFAIDEEGYNSGLLYHNGIAFPVRPDYLNLNQRKFAEALQKIFDYERRIRDAVEKGYIVNAAGEHISLRTPESIDVLGRLIEANVDSPNLEYFKDFISIWKKILGSSVQEHQYFHHVHPLIVPSVLEHPQTAQRDPAFYMIWKRVLGLFELWQEHQPHYKREELSLPTVVIQKVYVDKLVTFFEQKYVNISSALHMNEAEVRGEYDDVTVLVQRPRLNHKAFKIRVHVKSEVVIRVLVRFFLAPKYDSHGNEIPLEKNSQNFFQFDEFLHELPVGDNVIVRSTEDNNFATKDLPSAVELTSEAWNAAEGHGEFVIRDPLAIEKYPHHLLLPKGRSDGMPFVLMVYIAEFRPAKVPGGTDFDPSLSIGIGSGSRFYTDDPLGFPVNKPLYPWQVEGLHNIAFQDVNIYHKNTPEIEVPHLN